MKYLGLGMIRGIGPVHAKRMVQRFGEPDRPIAAQVMWWMLAGFRPPEWPAEPATGKPGNPALRAGATIDIST